MCERNPRQDSDHEYIFKPQVLTNVLTAESGEIAVALCQMKKADDLDARGNPVYRDDGTPQADTSVIWTKRRFLARLEIMRDLHSEVIERDQPWGLNGDPNPWDDIDAVPMFGVPTAYGPLERTPSDDTRFLDPVNDIVPRKHKLKTSLSSGSLGESPKHESTNGVSIEVPSQEGGTHHPCFRFFLCFFFPYPCSFPEAGSLERVHLCIIYLHQGRWQRPVRQRNHSQEGLGDRCEGRRLADRLDECESHSFQ